MSYADPRRARAEGGWRDCGLQLRAVLLCFAREETRSGERERGIAVNLPPPPVADSRDERSGEPADRSPVDSTLHLKEERGKAVLGMHDSKHEEGRGGVGGKMFAFAIDLHFLIHRIAL